jgi:chromosomal replication initiation ATPase DnaA
MTPQDIIKRLIEINTEAIELNERLSRFVYSPKNKRVEIVQRCVSAAFNVPLMVLQNKGRSDKVANARHACFLLCRELTELSDAQIAASFWTGMKHGTVWHGVEAAKNRMDTEPKFAAEVLAIRTECRARLDAHEMPLFAVSKKSKQAKKEKSK